jgi:lipid-A-disaccharide synthase
MKRKSFMLIACEASGDTLGAELAAELRRGLIERESRPTADLQPRVTSLEPRFFGAGGPRMAAAGVNLSMDMTAHAAIGLADQVKHLFRFRRYFAQLYREAIERQPEVIIGVDSGTFNLPFAKAIRAYTRPRSRWMSDWRPKIVQFVSPQVWGSRPWRAKSLERDHDLVLSIFPFEKAWYAGRAPGLAVEFVGHPMIDRFASAARGERNGEAGNRETPRVLLLPGSRKGELKRHLPVMIRALALMKVSVPGLRAVMVLPSADLARQAREAGLPSYLEAQAGELPQALMRSDVAISKTGTISMECAYFGVPTVTLYRTAWSTYQIGRQIVTVKWLTMPNILANEAIFPEFVQGDATPQNLANAALELLRNGERRARVKARLAEIVAALGAPGAAGRAAQAILRLI